MSRDISHPDMVATLAKSGSAICQSLTPYTVHLWHMATGVSGEAGELLEAFTNNDLNNLRTNVVEELGDLEFYIEGIRAPLHITREDTLMTEVSPKGNLTAALELTIHASALLDSIKKVAVYNKSLDRASIISTLSILECRMCNIRHNMNIEREEILDHNIDKLSVRYRQLKYTDEAAQLRADKQ